MVFQTDDIETQKTKLISEISRLKGEYSSSAADLDNNLRHSSFRTARHFAHDYRLPGNISPAEYEKHFYETYELPLRVIQNTIPELQNPPEESLEAAVKQSLTKELPYTKMLLKKEFETLRKLNPELQELRPSSFADFADVVRGVIYQFDIPELKYFLSRPDDSEKNKANKFNQNFESAHGIKINFLLAPESRKQLETATQNRASLQKDTESHKRFMYFMETRGFYND